MELLASLFAGKPLNILALAVLFLAGYLALRFTALGIARHPPFAAHRVHRLRTLCSMGVAGSDQDSGSEHPGRPSRDVAGAGNSLSVGAFPRVSTGMLHRSPFGGSRLTTGCS